MPDRIPGEMTDTVTRLFGRGEAFDSEGFASFFTDHPVYHFGNWPPCLTKPEIVASVTNFFASVEALYHNIRNMWEVGDTLFVEMDVQYWRKDGSSVNLPCADIFRFEGPKILELRIFMDANPVGNPAAQIPESVSVMTQSEGKRATPPGYVKQYFAQHPEGKARAAGGFAPKWSIAGPKWRI